MARKSRPRVPGEAPKHRSVSQLELLAKCGQAFAFRYIDGLTEPGSLAKAKGTAVHDAAQSNFEQKISSDVDVPVDEFRDQAVARFEAETRGALLYTRDEESTGIKKSVAVQKDATAALAGFYHATVSPDYQPQAVETEFEIPLPAADTYLVGVIDLVDLIDRVVDHKTSKRSKSQAEADHSLQITAYSAARTRAGHPPPESILDTAVQTAGGKTYRNKLITKRGPDDYRALAARVVAAEQIIKAGNFGPAPVAAWWCSPQWCGYWAQCPFVNRKLAPAE